MRSRPRNHPTLGDLAKTEKRCRTCKEVKPLTPEFWPRDANQPDGFQGWCKDCKQAKQRADYTYEKGRRGILWAKYRMTLEDYDRMLEAQDGKCLICGRKDLGFRGPQGAYRKDGTPPENKAPLCVDHDHETGRVRGLLCTRCNAAVGNVQESPDIALKLHDYLVKVVQN